jgi:guanylate kinase
MKNKIFIVLSSPSGGGKTTVAHHLMSIYPNAKFSISATTRPPRHNEINGKDYYFLSKEEFLNKINNNELVEYEEIFGNYYGTLKSELDKARTNNNILIFDVDVKGALSIKKLYPDESLLIFIAPPSLEILEQRLRNRNTETDEQIKTRISRAKMELDQVDKFDYVIVNNQLEKTLDTVTEIAKKEIKELA